MYMYHVGALLYRIGQLASVIPYLEQACARMPWFHRSAYKLARRLIDLGNTAEGDRLLAMADSLQQH